MKGDITMKFWKMNGAGNDFLIINNLSGKIRPEQWPQIAQTVCERHRSGGGKIRQCRL